MTEWKPVTEPPELLEDEWYDKTSNPVLVFTKYSTMRVAVLQKWLDFSKPTWRTTCSEAWDITDDVLFWQPLPAPPQ
jgi:hypothetical protein